MNLTELFTDYTFQVVALGSLLLGVISGVLGSFAVMKKQSLLGDGVSHAALPGVVLAFLLTGTKSTEVLLAGALIAGLLATFCIIGIVKNSRVKFDAALAVVMSVFFGLGLVLLTFVQKMPEANQAGLNRFIFGQASSLLQSDVALMAAAAAIVLAVVALFWKEFKLHVFDHQYASTLGYPTGRINAVLSLLIVIGIIIGLQTVGVVLMSAMLIAPAVAARQWSRRFSVMVILSAVIGGVCGVIGTAASSSVEKLPTGPCIVIAVTAVAAFSLLFAPRGILFQWIKRKKSKRALKRRAEEHHAG